MRERNPTLAALGALAVLLAFACAPPEGPQPIAWDREPCAHCHMLISDPAFAAQLVAADGTVASFDDPGCLLAHRDARHVVARKLWFHHHAADRWIRGDAVGFVRVAGSPMDYRFGAVDAGEPGALTLGEARALVVARSEAR
jgi:hypothetical protein